MSFDDITKNLDYACFFDTEVWTRDVLQNNYLIIEKDGFAIDVDYKSKFGVKVGHSRGGIRFNTKEKTLDEYNSFLHYLKKELARKGFIYSGISMFDLPNKYWQNDFYEISEDFYESFTQAALIYPKEGWLSKFNSKKRYNLTYAGKKGVNVKLLTQNDLSDSPDYLEKFYTLALDTLERHKEIKHKSYPFPSKEVFERLFKYMNFRLFVGVLDESWISYSLVILNPKGNRAYRVYAGANIEGIKLRVPSYIETIVVEHLYKESVKVYDLYGVMEGKKHTYSEFKKDLADELIPYPKYLILPIKPAIANLAIRLQLTLKKLRST